MDTSHDIWEALGDVASEDLPQVLHQLFAVYERLERHNGTDPEALNFFKNLGRVIKQVNRCNLNRR